jgi:hypothetical protein
MTLTADVAPQARWRSRPNGSKRVDGVSIASRTLRHRGFERTDSAICSIESCMSTPSEGWPLSGERRLQAPLLSYLQSRRWVRHDTLIVHELPWHGRRVDMVTRTRGGSITSYEFKIGSFSRVLEQAIYNRLSFDRSYVVVAAMPRRENIQLSERYNVGIMMVDQLEARCLLGSPVHRAEPALRARLTARVLAAGGADV